MFLYLHGTVSPAQKPEFVKKKCILEKIPGTFELWT